MTIGPSYGYGWQPYVQTSGTSATNTVFLTGLTVMPAASPTEKEKTMTTEEIRGGAPTKTLFAEYVATKGGYRGQVRWGDPSVKGNEASVLWEGPVVEVVDGAEGTAKTSALKAAEAALTKAITKLFDA